MTDYPLEFDGPDYCLVCGKYVGNGLSDKECACPECPICTEIGNPNCYGSHIAKGNRAFNLADLAAHLGASNVDGIEKRLFKDTICGISFYANRETGEVSVAGYAEGTGDASCVPITFTFPIDLDEFDKAVERADLEGCELFDEYHCSVCGGEIAYEESCTECEVETQ